MSLQCLSLTTCGITIVTDRTHFTVLPRGVVLTVNTVSCLGIARRRVVIAAARPTHWESPVFRRTKVTLATAGLDPAGALTRLLFTQVV